MRLGPSNAFTFLVPVDPGLGEYGTSAWWQAQQILVSPVSFPDAAGGLKAGLIAHRLGANCRLTQIWNTQLATTGVYVSPPMLANGVAYAGTGDNATLVALDARTGAKFWESAKAGDSIYGPPIVANGTVYVGSYDRKLYAYRPTNLLANPSYEGGLTGWYAWQSTATRIVGGHTGSYAARVAAACPSGATCSSYTWGNVSSQVPNPPQGGAYAASIWVKAQGGAIGKAARVVLRENGGATPSANTGGAAVTLTGAWQQLAVSRVITASGRSGLEMYVSQTAPAGGDALIIDDARIVKTN